MRHAQVGKRQWTGWQKPRSLDGQRVDRAMRKKILVEWDETKRLKVLAERGIDFGDAAKILNGKVLELRSDRKGEERYIAIGRRNGVPVAVIYTMRNSTFRIISARRARKNEEIAYNRVVTTSKNRRKV
jgi:uncharacterized DUF497 family protein